MRHLVIGQPQKAPNFSAFHWSPHGCLIIIGQHFVTTRVVHLPKRTETSFITKSDQSRANHQLLQLCTVHTAWSNTDQAVRVVHSCKSWLSFFSYSRSQKQNFDQFCPVTGRFGPIPFRSGRFGLGRFGPILEVGRFGPVLVGRFGPFYFIYFLGNKFFLLARLI